LGDEFDFEAVQAFAANLNLSLHIGDPKRNERDQSWTIGIGRRQAGSSDSAVIAVAQLSLRELQRTYDEINIGARGSIVLFRADG
jgi:hypothetical protein